MSNINVTPDLTEHIVIASRSFRLGMEAMGSENLARFIDALSPVLQALPYDIVQRLAAILNESLASQARKDFSYLADLLEYQIVPLLEETEGQILQIDPKGKLNG